MAKAIAIVGGGPKAAAIAAKAVAMRDIGLSAPDVAIFEARSIGSAWKGGDGGYSDGASRLCTPAPRDLGFPYGNDLSASCAGRMFAEFSWASFLVDLGGDQYARWVNRGTPRPTHGEFAQYLEWAVAKAGARVVIDEVTGLSWNGQWGVATRNNGDAGRFDGVVITGPGPPVPALLNRPSNRILDGRNFWTNEALVRSLVAQDRDPTVVIIGAGGTAAAVAGWFVRHDFSRLPIHIVGREATLYTRSPGYFEDRLFSDDDAWDDLRARARQEFVARLTRGVVWQDVIDGLSRHDNLTYRCGQVVRIDVADDELGVVVDTAGAEPGVGADGHIETTTLPASLVVNCRGFDGWWFSSFFSSSDPASRVLKNDRATLEETVTRALALASPFPYPGLHVPMRASMAGPGAANLMALGWMSDRILRPYLDSEELARHLGLA